MAARGAGMVTLLLPEGCAGDSGVALPGAGCCPRGQGRRAAQVAGGAVRSRRWGAGCWTPLAAARALWSSRPRGEGGEGRAGEDRVRAAPLARIPHLPGRAGAAGTGSGGHRGKGWWSEVDSGKGWVDTGSY